MSDPRSAAEILYPTQNSAAPGTAKIELHYLPIAHRGHAFLRFVDSSGETVGELHGLGRSKHTGEIMEMGMDGADLVARDEVKGSTARSSTTSPAISATRPAQMAGRSRTATPSPSRLGAPWTSTWMVRFRRRALLESFRGGRAICSIPSTTAMWRRLTFQ